MMNHNWQTLYLCGRKRVFGWLCGILLAVGVWNSDTGIVYAQEQDTITERILPERATSTYFYHRHAESCYEDGLLICALKEDLVYGKLTLYEMIVTQTQNFGPLQLLPGTYMRAELQDTMMLLMGEAKPRFSFIGTSRQGFRYCDNHIIQILQPGEYEVTIDNLMGEFYPDRKELGLSFSQNNIYMLGDASEKPCDGQENSHDAQENSFETQDEILTTADSVSKAMESIELVRAVQVQAEELQSYAMSAAPQKTIMTLTNTVKTPFYQKKVFKTAALVTGTLVFGFMLTILLYLLYSGVRVYNYDGNRYHFIGTLRIQRGRFAFHVKLPELLYEQATTDRFMLKPGRLFVSMYKHDKLIFSHGSKRKVSYISDCMIANLT